MLVVAPLMVLVIATLVGFMIALVGNVTVSNARAQVQYDTQEALNEIEQDAFYSTSFLSTYTPQSPQGKDNNVQAFNSSSGDVIFNEPATDKNPADPTRQVVYFANQPNACTGQVWVNNPLFAKAIYYTKTVNGVTSLYRRSVVSPNDQNSTVDSTTTCAAPWQRNSCVSINYNSNTLCVAKDERLIDNVSAFTVSYYNKSDPSTPISDPTQANSIKVTITVQQGSAGDTINNTMYLSASRIDTQSIVPQGY